MTGLTTDICRLNHWHVRNQGLILLWYWYLCIARYKFYIKRWLWKLSALPWYFIMCPIKHSGSTRMFCNWRIIGAAKLIYQHFIKSIGEKESRNDKPYIIIWRKRMNIFNVTKWIGTFNALWKGHVVWYGTICLWLFPSTNLMISHLVTLNSS